MGVYYVNEAAFELPEIGFVDRTVHALDTRAPSGAPILVSVDRNPLPEGKGLGDLVAENARNAAMRLRAHTVVFRREGEIAGCPAVDIAAEWRGAGGVVYTRQAHLVAAGTWIVFSASALADERAACDAVLDRAIATFRLRD